MREGEREGGRERGNEGGREGGKGGEREGKGERGRERGREGEREGGNEGGKEETRRKGGGYVRGRKKGCKCTRNYIHVILRGTNTPIMESGYQNKTHFEQGRPIVIRNNNVPVHVSIHQTNQPIDCIGYPTPHPPFLILASSLSNRPCSTFPAPPRSSRSPHRRACMH